MWLHLLAFWSAEPVPIILVPPPARGVIASSRFVQVRIFSVWDVAIDMGNAYSIEINIMAEQGTDLLAGSVVKIDFWIRDEQDSLTALAQGCFDCKIYAIPNPRTGVLADDPIEEFQAFQITEDGQVVPGLFRATIDTSLKPDDYLGGAMFAVLASVPYPTGGQVLGEKTFYLRNPMTIPVK